MGEMGQIRQPDQHYQRRLEGLPAWFRPYKMSPEEKDTWDIEMLALWQAGVIQPIDKEWVAKYGLPDVLLPHFVIDEGLKNRVILNMKFSNVSQEADWFLLARILAFAKCLSQGQYWAKMDFKAGWHHVALHQCQMRVCGFVYNNQIWIYNALAFGDSTAPWVFTYLMVTVEEACIKLCKAWARYIDDLATGLTHDPHTSQPMMMEVMKMVIRFGGVLACRKCSGITQKEDFLGIEVDTNQMVLTVPRKRVDKMKKWLEIYQSNQTMTCRQLMGYLGMVVSTCTIFPRFHLHIGEVFQWALSKGLDEKVQIPPTMWEGMTILVDKIDKCHLPIHPCAKIDWTIIGDATPTKVGAAFYNGLPPYAAPTSSPGEKIDEAVSDVIPPELKTIADIEAWTILWAAIIWIPMMGINTWLAIIGDNTVAM